MNTECTKKSPVLVIMAAGLGSRYGGLKQMDPIDSEGQLIIDFSIYDAMRAGFKKVVFVIKKELEADFRERIGNRVSRHMETAYAYQLPDALPEGYSIPEGRTKPWGTAHAVLAAAEAVGDAPFAVINADDYYGRSAFESLYNFLSTTEDDDKFRYCMVGYELMKTLTENGYVSRGICDVKDGYLASVTERTHIEKKDGGAAYTEDGENWVKLPTDSIVSMNTWGFTAGFMNELRGMMPHYLDEILKTNPMKGEIYLPSTVSELLEKNKATVRVLTSADRWYGVTYHEDKETVVNAIQALKDSGLYPNRLWD